MPFKSQAQWEKCYAMQSRGSDWNCDEFAEESPPYDSLPRYAKNRSSRGIVPGKMKLVYLKYAVVKEDGTWVGYEGTFYHAEGASLFDELQQWWLREGKKTQGGVGVALMSVDWRD